MAPGIVPAPVAGVSGVAGEVDRSDVIEPESRADVAKFEQLFDSRSSPSELQDKGILKGQHGELTSDSGARLICFTQVHLMTV